MQWKKPDFQEINLSGEVTAYVNSDDRADAVRPADIVRPKVCETAAPAHSATRDESA